MDADQTPGTGMCVPQALPRQRMLPALSLRSNFAWTLVGNLIYTGSQWGMLVVLAKLGDAAMVGCFTLGLAVSAPIMMFARLQLRSLQATDARGDYHFWDYFALRLVTSVFALGVVTGVAALGGYRPEAALVILIIGSAKGVESQSDTIYGLLQRNERLDLIAISKMIKGPLSLLAIWGLVGLTGSIVWGSLGLLIAWSLVLVTYESYNARRALSLEPPPIRGHHRSLPARLAVLRQLAWLALPLGFVSLLDSLNVNLPRYLVERRLGEAALGYYAAMAYIVVAGNMIVGALSESASPRLARYYLTDSSAFRRLLWRLLGLGALLGGGGLLLSLVLGRPLLTLLYRPDYARHADVFVWLMAAAGIGYVARFLICAMTVSRQIKAQTPLYGGVLLTTAALSWVLIPRYGLLGAAWALGGAMAVLLLGAGALLLAALRTGTNQQDESAPTEAGASLPSEVR